MRHLPIPILFCLLALPAAAAEDDGNRAPPERWSHPHGPAGGSGRSDARPPESLGGILWSFQAQTEILAPPVVWDGVIFLLDGESLVALDAESGRPVAARAAVGKPVHGPVASGRAVYLIEGGDKLTLHRLSGRRLARSWSRDLGTQAGGLCVFSSELYVTTRKGLLRLRRGARDPVWKAEGLYEGQPCLYGDHVYALRAGEDGKIHLVVHARADGKELFDIALSGSPAPGARVGAAKQLIGVRFSGRGGRWALLRRTLKEDKLTVSFLRDVEMIGEPLVGTSVMLGVTKRNHAWSVVRMEPPKQMQDKRLDFPLVTIKQRPELFEGADGCTLMAGTMCFGTWMGAVNSNLILWHVSEREDTAKALKGGVRFFGVPIAHERLMLVARDGKSLHAVGPEELGE